MTDNTIVSGPNFDLLQLADKVVLVVKDLNPGGNPSPPPGIFQRSYLLSFSDTQAPIWTLIQNTDPKVSNFQRSGPKAGSYDLGGSNYDIASFRQNGDDHTMLIRKDLSPGGNPPPPPGIFQLSFLLIGTSWVTIMSSDGTAGPIG